MRNYQGRGKRYTSVFHGRNSLQLPASPKFEML